MSFNFADPIGHHRLNADDTRLAALTMLEFQSPTAALIARPIPLMSRMTIWLITTLVASAFVVMGVFPIDRVVTAQGRVASEAKNIVVQPLEVSILRSIDVVEGQHVHAGDLLARLDPTFATADSASSAAQTDSLAAEIERLKAELSSRPYREDGSPASSAQRVMFNERLAERTAHRKNFDQKIRGAESKVEQAMSDLDGYEQRLVLAKELENGRRELERLQVGSRFNVLTATDNRVEVARGRDSAKAALETARREVAALVAERESYVDQNSADISQQLSDAERKLNEAQDTFHKANLRRRLVDMRADRDAVVLRIADVSVGAVMQSGDEFITLVPLGSPLEVDASVPGRDAGFLHVADPVTIKFDAFDYRSYGDAKGKVAIVSADSFTSADLVNPKPSAPPRQPQNRDQNAGAFYRVKIALGDVKLRNMAPDFKLTPGMPVTVDIKVGERTVLSYLLGRAIPALTEGMREP